MPRARGSKNPNTGFAAHPENINRAGRPPLGMTFAEGVRAYLEDTDGGKRKSIIEQMVAIAASKAKHGHYQFWEVLTNRAYGKTPDVVEMSTEKPPDLSKLTDEEIETLKRLLEKAKP